MGTQREGTYGYRARIGYTVAAVTTEVFPIDWYKIVPDGVTLMMITLPLGERSDDDARKCFDASIEGAKTFAASGADLVLLGGLPVNLSRGLDKLDDFLAKLADEIGVPVSSSTTAQKHAYEALGSRKVGTIHPFLPDQNSSPRPLYQGIFRARTRRLLCGRIELEGTRQDPDRVRARLGPCAQEGASGDRHVQFRLSALARDRCDRAARTGAEGQLHEFVAGDRLGIPAEHWHRRQDRRLWQIVAGTLTARRGARYKNARRDPERERKFPWRRPGPMSPFPCFRR